MSVPICVSTVRRGRPARPTRSTTVQVGVRLVRPVAQEAADHPGVDARQRRERRLVQADDIGGIAEAADPQPERGRPTPWSCANRPRPACRRCSQRVAGRHLAVATSTGRKKPGGSPRPERVAEAPCQLRPASPAWRTPRAAGRAMRFRMRTSSRPGDVVGMGMGEEDGVDPCRWRQASSWLRMSGPVSTSSRRRRSPSHHDRGAGAPVARLGRIAGAPVAGRHVPRRRSSARRPSRRCQAG